MPLPLHAHLAIASRVYDEAGFPIYFAIASAVVPAEHCLIRAAEFALVAAPGSRIAMGSWSIEVTPDVQRACTRWKAAEQQRELDEREVSS